MIAASVRESKPLICEADRQRVRDCTAMRDGKRGGSPVTAAAMRRQTAVIAASIGSSVQLNTSQRCPNARHPSSLPTAAFIQVPGPRCPTGGLLVPSLVQNCFLARHSVFHPLLPTTRHSILITTHFRHADTVRSACLEHTIILPAPRTRHPAPSCLLVFKFLRTPPCRQPGGAMWPLTPESDCLNPGSEGARSPGPHSCSPYMFITRMRR